jgi:hypothetical protein
LKFTLYVKGKKTAKIAGELRQPRGWDAGSSIAVRTTPGLEYTVDSFELNRGIAYDSVLPEDQKRVVRLVEDLAEILGFELEVIDVTKEKSIHRLVDERIMRITLYPTLITDSGKEIEGEITERKVRALIERKKK